MLGSRRRVALKRFPIFSPGEDRFGLFPNSGPEGPDLQLSRGFPLEGMVTGGIEPYIIFETFFSRSLSSRVLFNFPAGCTALHRFLAPFHTIASYIASLTNFKKNWWSILFMKKKNWGWEFTKTIIPFALVGYELIITNARYALVGCLSPDIQRALME